MNDLVTCDSLLVTSQGRVCIWLTRILHNHQLHARLPSRQCNSLFIAVQLNYTYAIIKRLISYEVDITRTRLAPIPPPSHLLLPSRSTRRELRAEIPDISATRLSYMSRTMRQRRCDRFRIWEMRLCWRLRRRSLSPPATRGHFSRPRLFQKNTRLELKPLPFAVTVESGVCTSGSVTELKMDGMQL